MKFKRRVGVWICGCHGKHRFSAVCARNGSDLRKGLRNGPHLIVSTRCVNPR